MVERLTVTGLLRPAGGLVSQLAGWPQSSASGRAYPGRPLGPEIVHGLGVHVVGSERGQAEGTLDSGRQAVLVVVGVGDEVAGLHPRSHGAVVRDDDHIDEVALVADAQ